MLCMTSDRTIAATLVLIGLAGFTLARGDWVEQQPQLTNRYLASVKGSSGMGMGFNPKQDCSAKFQAANPTYITSDGCKDSTGRATGTKTCFACNASKSDDAYQQNRPANDPNATPIQLSNQAPLIDCSKDSTNNPATIATFGTCNYSAALSRNSCAGGTSNQTNTVCNVSFNKLQDQPK